MEIHQFKIFGEGTPLLYGEVPRDSRRKSLKGGEVVQIEVGSLNVNPTWLVTIDLTGEVGDDGYYPCKWNGYKPEFFDDYNENNFRIHYTQIMDIPEKGK